MQLDTIVYRVSIPINTRHVLECAGVSALQRIEVTMNEHVQTEAGESLFNPLAPEFIRNPYPYYDRLRTTDPMHLTAHGAFVASHHAEPSLALRDTRSGKDYVEPTIRPYPPDLIKAPHAHTI